MKSLVSLLLIAALFSTATLAAGPPYSDDLSSPEKESRRATRGPWKYENNTTICTQDDELYKKFKDHGPVTWYDLDFTDGTVAFSMNADADVKSVVFTINDPEGHLFRFVCSDKLTLIKAFSREGDGVEDLLERENPPLKKGEWTDVIVRFKGNSATVKIGDSEKSVTHPAIARKKSIIGIGFAFGTFEYKNFSVK